MLPAGRVIHTARGPQLVCESCPCCGRADKYFLNLTTGKSLCHSCNVKSSSWKQLKEVLGGDFSYDSEYQMSTRAVLPPPDRDIHTTLKDLPEAGIEFLGGRSVSSIERFKWDPVSKELVVQIDPWSEEFPVEFLRRRILQPGSKWVHYKGVNTLEYGFGLRDHFSEVVVIVEGIFDVITPQLLGIAVANLGTNVGRNMATWVFSKRPKKCIVWLDPDEAGIRGTAKVADALTSWGICPTIYSPEPYKNLPWVKVDKEPGDCESDDPLVASIRRMCL